VKRLVLFFQIISPFVLLISSASVCGQGQGFKSKLSKIDSLLGADPEEAILLADQIYNSASSKQDTLNMARAMRAKANGLQLISFFDSAIQVIDYAIQLSENELRCEYALSLNVKAQILRKQGKFIEALDLLFPALKRLSKCYKGEEVLNTLYLISLCYDRLELYSRAIYTLNVMSSLAEILDNNVYLFRSYNTAFMIFTKSGKRPEPLMEKMISTAKESNDLSLELTAYNNLAAHYTRVNNDSAAEYCYLKAYEIVHQLNNQQNKSIIALNLCVFYNRIGRWDLAEPYFKESQSLKEYISEDNWKGLYYFFESIYYRKNAKMNLAQESLEKSLQIMEKQNNYPLLLNIHRQSANFYRERGNFEKAYYHMNRLQEVQAVLDENEQDNEVNRLYYSVLLDLEKEKAKTIMLRNENLEKQSDIFILLIVVSVFSLLVISMLFYFFSNRFRNRILRIEEQKESLLAARLRLSKELSARNKEIAAVVLNQVMHNEQSLDVIQKLRKIGEQSSKEIQKELYELASLLASSQNKNIWNEFEKYFKQLNPEFFSRLTSKHENLTSRDLRYSALISLQISSKEMSLITGMTLQSIHVLRSRLRNKLGLDKDADLAVYLSSFSSEE
jgi:DNA-binding CsgD family transcriptional regulator